MYEIDGNRVGTGADSKCPAAGTGAERRARRNLAGDVETGARDGSEGARKRLRATSEIRTARRPDADATAQAAANGASQTAVATTAEAPAPEIRRRPTRARTPAEPLQMYPYLRSELTRIGALTALIAIALGALTFVLG